MPECSRKAAGTQTCPEGLASSQKISMTTQHTGAKTSQSQPHSTVQLRCGLRHGQMHSTEPTSDREGPLHLQESWGGKNWEMCVCVCVVWLGPPLSGTYQPTSQVREGIGREQACILMKIAKVLRPLNYEYFLFLTTEPGWDETSCMRSTALSLPSWGFLPRGQKLQRGCFHAQTFQKDIQGRVCYWM